MKKKSKIWACPGVTSTNLGPWGKQMDRIDVYLAFIWTLTKKYPNLDLAIKEKECCLSLSVTLLAIVASRLIGGEAPRDEAFHGAFSSSQRAGCPGATQGSRDLCAGPQLLRAPSSGLFFPIHSRTITCLSERKNYFCPWHK